MYGVSQFGQGFGMMNSWGGGLGVIGPWVIILALWALFWKGLALWHSSQRKQPWWFVVLLIVNTAGILEIIYLFGIAKLKFDELFSKTTPMKTDLSKDMSHGEKQM